MIKAHLTENEIWHRMTATDKPEVPRKDKSFPYNLYATIYFGFSKLLANKIPQDYKETFVYLLMKLEADQALFAIYYYVFNYRYVDIAEIMGISYMQAQSLKEKAVFTILQLDGRYMLHRGLNAYRREIEEKAMDKYKRGINFFLIDLDLEPLTHNRLLRAGYSTDLDFKGKTIADILQIRGVGPKTAEEIITKLSKKGVHIQ